MGRACAGVGVRCDVIAPSKTPRAAGERVKTDRRDAERLVRLLMAGSLSVVGVPAVEVEAVRDLVRSRAHLRDDLARARQRVSKMLLRYGRVYPKRVCWTKQHRLWLADQRWDHTASELAYLDYLAAVDGLVSRRQAIDERLSRIAQEPSLWPTVARLRCFRGVDTLTALALAVEVGEWHRFRRPARACAADRVARPDAAVSDLPPPARARKATQSGHGRRRPRAGRVLVGGGAGAIRIGR